MSVEASLFSVGRTHHAALLRVLTDLEAVAAGGALPPEADRLLRAVWPFLQAYGQRDASGGVRLSAVPLVAFVPPAGPSAASGGVS